MKTKIIFLLFILFSSVKIFASTSLKVSYSNSNVGINYFLCYEEELSLSAKIENEAYKNIEKKFYDFLYFTDSLFKISSKLNSNILFCSEHDFAELNIGEIKYYFIPQEIVDETQFDTNELIHTKDFNNLTYIVSFICKEYKIENPQERQKNRRLYSLKLKSIPEIDFSDSKITDIIFFYPGGEIYYSPVFELEGKFFIGLYYSLQDVKKMKEALKEKYDIDSIVKEFPLDFNIIEKAYFN